MPGIQLQCAFEGLDGALETVGIVMRAAGEIPGVDIARIQSLRLLEEALGRIPLLAGGANAARQDVSLGIARVEPDGALRFVEGALPLIEVQ